MAGRTPLSENVRTGSTEEVQPGDQEERGPHGLRAGRYLAGTTRGALQLGAWSAGQSCLLRGRFGAFAGRLARHAVGSFDAAKGRFEWDTRRRQTGTRGAWCRQCCAPSDATGASQGKRSRVRLPCPARREARQAGEDAKHNVSHARGSPRPPEGVRGRQPTTEQKSGRGNGHRAHLGQGRR